MNYKRPVRSLSIQKKTIVVAENNSFDDRVQLLDDMTGDC
jgi:hypothetical protein